MRIDNTKEKILHVAGLIFSKFGFHKTTVDEIARAAHKAKGSIYYYFRNKEELFQGVVEKEFQTLRSELVASIDKSKNAKEKLANYIIVRMQTIHKLANFYDALKNDYLSYLPFIEKIRAKYDNEEIVLVKSLLTSGVNNNEFEIRDIELTASALLTVLKGLEIPFFINEEYMKLENRMRELISIFIRGIEKR